MGKERRPIGMYISPNRSIRVRFIEACLSQLGSVASPLSLIHASYHTALAISHHGCLSLHLVCPFRTWLPSPRPPLHNLIHTPHTTSVVFEVVGNPRMISSATDHSRGADSDRLHTVCVGLEDGCWIVRKSRSPSSPSS